MALTWSLSRRLWKIGLPKSCLNSCIKKFKFTQTFKFPNEASQQVVGFHSGIPLHTDINTSNAGGHESHLVEDEVTRLIGTTHGIQYFLRMMI